MGHKMSKREPELQPELQPEPEPEPELQPEPEPEPEPEPISKVMSILDGVRHMIESEPEPEPNPPNAREKKAEEALWWNESYRAQSAILRSIQDDEKAVKSNEKAVVMAASAPRLDAREAYEEAVAMAASLMATAHVTKRDVDAANAAITAALGRLQSINVVNVFDDASG